MGLPNGPGIELPAAVSVPRNDRRPPGVSPTDAGGWGAPEHPGVAAGQLQCLVRQPATPRHAILSAEVSA